jgi:hypothetical protein
MSKVMGEPPHLRAVWVACDAEPKKPEPNCTPVPFANETATGPAVWWMLKPAQLLAPTTCTVVVTVSPTTGEAGENVMLTVVGPAVLLGS